MLTTQFSQARAVQLLRGMSALQKDLGGQEQVHFSFNSDVQKEIGEAWAELDRLDRRRFSTFDWLSSSVLERVGGKKNDSVTVDVALWRALESRRKPSIKSFEDIYAALASDKQRVSALLGLHLAAHKFPDEVKEFLTAIEGGRNAELAEWARLFLQESRAIASNKLEILQDPVSSTPFVHIPGREFDTTIPLVFYGAAFTRVGPALKRTIISPMWFERILGSAVALTRQETFLERLIVQKTIAGQHWDGSDHYDIFPFNGRSERVFDAMFRHNYWATLHRPFYSSGRAEHVTASAHRIANVPLTFARVAETTTPKRYEVNGTPLVETVRGTYFGYGHIDTKVLISQKLDLQPGHFQLAPRINPFTGRRSNTVFRGVFYGKVVDADGDGRLDMNAHPIRCTHEGKLDYFGDGKLGKDPLRPDDW